MKPLGLLIAEMIVGGVVYAQNWTKKCKKKGLSLYHFILSQKYFFFMMGMLMDWCL